MSKETLEWLRGNVRVGFTGENGPAWWANSGEYMADGTHFEGPVPAGEVRRVLSIPIREGSVETTYVNEDGETVTRRDPHRKAMVNGRNGDILGVFKEGYRFHDYTAWTLGALEQVTDLRAAAGGTVGDTEIGVSSVGLLRRGGVAWVQVKLPTTYEVAGFGYQPHMTAATSCDGSMQSNWFTGMGAVVCDNTLATAASSAVTRLKVPHTRNSLPRLEAVRFELGLMLKAADDFQVMAEEWMGTEVTDADFRAWMDEMYPLPEDVTTKGGKRGLTLGEARRDELERLWFKDSKVAPWAGTKFGILQLDNTYRTWERPVRGADGGRMERHFEGLIDGTRAAEDQKALDALDRVLERRLVIA